MLTHKRSSIEIKECSIVLDLLPIMNARNIQTPFTFLLKIGISNSTASKMLKGKAVQVNFDQLTKLCLNLNCTPNDIMALRYLTVPENHALKVMRKLESHEEEKSVKEWMSGKSVAEVREMMKK